MDIIQNWLALLPSSPPEDEFGRPWALHTRTGVTPAQARYFAALGGQLSGAEPSAQAPSSPEIPRANAGRGQRAARTQGGQREPIAFHIGVLTDTHLYMCEGNKPVKRAIAAPVNIGEVFQLALAYQLAGIWVYPGTQVSAQAGEAFNVAPEWEVSKLTTYTEAKPPRTMFTSAYKKREARAAGESGESVYVSYPGHNSAWGLARLSSPGALLFTVAYIEDALGFPIQYSPAACGRRVITETNRPRERAGWIAQVDMRKYPVCCAENVRDLGWKRGLLPEESGEPWLLAYDKNSQYASACTGARLGSGEPEEIHAPIEFNPEKLVAGIWHCKISGESLFDGAQLPHPTNGKTEGWFWSYTVKLLLEVGYTVEIDHAWIWRESHTILRPFAEKLWRARAALGDRGRYPVEEARVAAQGISKDAMNHSIGTLNSRKFLTDGGKWFRPDWRELLRDNALYQMFRRILKNHEAGYRLLGAHVDCLFYASPTSDHAQAIPDWLEKIDETGEAMRRAGLGGYKPKFPIDIPLEIARDWFNDPAVSIEKINALLDQYCLEQEEGYNHAR